jgi:CDP-glucose 4,6-dehydratase
MGGLDPYSASKGCVEIVTRSLANAWKNQSPLRIMSARAGNVFGGGDWSNERLIPDFFRALKSGNSIKLRNPESVRPWQFVIEPLLGYLKLAQYAFQLDFYEFDSFNFGPNYDSQISVSNLSQLFHTRLADLKIDYGINDVAEFHESSVLRLNSEKSSTLLGWEPFMTLENAVEFTCEWYLMLEKNRIGIEQLTMNQIKSYLKTIPTNE